MKNSEKWKMKNEVFFEFFFSFRRTLLTNDKRMHMHNVLVKLRFLTYVTRIWVTHSTPPGNSLRVCDWLGELICDLSKDTWSVLMTTCHRSSSIRNVIVTGKSWQCTIHYDDICDLLYYSCVCSTAVTKHNQLRHHHFTYEI